MTYKNNPKEYSMPRLHKAKHFIIGNILAYLSASICFSWCTMITFIFENPFHAKISYQASILVNQILAYCSASITLSVIVIIAGLFLILPFTIIMSSFMLFYIRDPKTLNKNKTWLLSGSISSIIFYSWLWLSDNEISIFFAILISGGIGALVFKWYYFLQTAFNMSMIAPTENNN